MMGWGEAIGGIATTWDVSLFTAWFSDMFFAHSVGASQDQEPFVFYTL